MSAGSVFLTVVLLVAANFAAGVDGAITTNTTASLMPARCNQLSKTSTGNNIPKPTSTKQSTKTTTKVSTSTKKTTSKVSVTTIPATLKPTRTSTKLTATTTKKTTSKLSTTTKKTTSKSASMSIPATTSPAASAWLKPTPGTSFLWSLEAAIPAKPLGENSLDLSKMQIYDVDLFDSTKSEISTYKKAGKKVVCYFSAGSFEDWREDATSFTKSCYCNKGSSCKMQGWDEWWLDLHTPACVANIQSIMKKRIELAKSKGCDAVEPDNTDSYTNESGWKTTITDQFNYLSFMSTTAHQLGLGIALKNGPDMISEQPEIVKITDFVIIEECQAYDECEAYKPFVDAKKAAFQIEYETSITCSKILPGFFALSYTSYNVNYKNVQAYCPKP